MPKKIVWVTGLVLLMICLGGCQLAREDLGAEDAEGLPQDRFIGVYITFAPLDPSKEYYATAKPRRHEGYESTTYEFEGVPGIALFEVLIKEEGDTVGYWTSVIGEEMLDAQIGIHSKDKGEDLDLSGKLYILENKVLYVNRVYQDSAGGIYMLGGEGIFGAGSMKTTATESLESEEKAYSTHVTVALEGVDKPEQDVFKEFDSNDKVIKTTVITPDNIPETINLHPDCAYVIAEVHSSSAEGLKITRTLLDVEVGYYTYKYPGERGFLIGKFINISRDN